MIWTAEDHMCLWLWCTPLSGMPSRNRKCQRGKEQLACHHNQMGSSPDLPLVEVFHFWTNPDKGWRLFPTNWASMWCSDMFKQNNPGSWIRMTFDVNLSFHAMCELHKCLPNHYVLSRIKEAQSAKWMICTSWFHDPLAIKEAEEVEEVKEAETFPKPSEVENPQDRCFPWLPVLSG